jgi:hypothetical protein
MKVTIIIVRKGYFCPDKAILSGIYPPYDSYKTVFVWLWLAAARFFAAKIQQKSAVA